MAYRDDIAALSPDHHWVMDGAGVTDEIGTTDQTNVGTGTGTAIAEDTTLAKVTDGTGDRCTVPITTNITGALAQKAVAGWFMTTAIQPPPKLIYGEGDATPAFQFVMSFGNTVMAEAVDGSDVVQVVGPVLRNNRAYHLCAIFEDDANGNYFAFYVDGVLQNSITAGFTSLAARTVLPTWGDHSATSGIGGTTVLLNASVNGHYNHWATWSGANAELTATEVREELFEKGALPDTTISSDTQANMQTALDALASSVRPNAPLCIRVEDVSGGGDLALDADDITFDSEASIHVQWMGTGTLTWKNDNGGDASIASTPNGGTLTFVKPVTVTITVVDASTGSPIENARVLLEADTGGPLAVGTAIIDKVFTNASGVVTTSFDYSADQPVVAKIRKGDSPEYKASTLVGTITTNGLDATSQMVSD